MSTQVHAGTVRSADGTRIGYTTLGAGPPVVVVHGAWATGEAWLEVARHLEDGFTCHLLDRRGRAQNPDHGDDYRLEREAEDIAAVLDEAGPGASLLGHSSGAICALEAARQVPVERLVLYEPPLHMDDFARDLLPRIRAAVTAGDHEAAATLFFREEARVPEAAVTMLTSTPQWRSMAALAPACLREWDAILAADLTVDRYRDVTSPTLLLAGTETSDHPSFATWDLETTLPDARVAMLDGQDHMAHRTAPGLVADTVRTFLEPRGA